MAETTTCPGCQQRDALIATLLGRVSALERQVDALQARLGQNSSNSSVPPSANPPTAPAPTKKKPSGRKRGGQPGHRGHQRIRLEADRVDHVIALIPSQCENCSAGLAQQSSPSDPPPTWHQVAELPRTSAVISEYQGHARTCTRCGHVTRESIPAEITADAFGPRLAAAVGYLAAQQLSVRGVQEVASSLFGVPLSLGGIAALRQEVGSSLAQPHQQAAKEAQQATVKNVDETTWKRAGQRCWLWLAATSCVCYFLIRPRRNAKALRELLGQTPVGVLITDRAKAYSLQPHQRRQFCWAHLKRDFQAMVDRNNEGSPVGKKLLGWTKVIFDNWWDFRQGSVDRAGLQKRLELTRYAVGLLLQSGAASQCAATASTCRQLLVAQASLWVFVEQVGVEPTNNAAERALRRAVLWRKRSFGSNSARGLRFVERLLTVTGTLKLRGGNVLEYLREAVSAHRHGLPAPCLLTSP